MNHSSTSIRNNQIIDIESSINSNSHLTTSTLTNYFNNYASSDENNTTKSVNSGGTQVSILEIKFKVGNLVWAKVSGHPWWPCMISQDINENNTHIKSIGLSRPKRMFYVEFYGPSIEHAWVPEGGLIEYEGIEAFKAYAQRQVDQAPTKSQKEKLAERFQLKVALTRREQWEKAVEEADEALKTSIHMRQESFIKKLSSFANSKRSQLSAPTQNEFKQIQFVDSDEENLTPSIDKLIDINNNNIIVDDYLLKKRTSITNETKRKRLISLANSEEKEAKMRKIELTQKEDFLNENLTSHDFDFHTQTNVNTKIEQIKTELVDEATRLSSSSDNQLTYHQLTTTQSNILSQQVSLHHESSGEYINHLPQEKTLYKIPEVVKRGRGRRPKANKTLPPLTRSLSAPGEDELVTHTLVRGNKRYVTATRKTKIMSTLSEPSLQQQQEPNKSANLIDKYEFGYKSAVTICKTSDESEDPSDDSSDENYSDVEKTNIQKQKAKHQTDRRRKRAISSSSTSESSSTKHDLMANGNSTAETYLIDRYKYAVRHIKQGLSVEEACNKYRISKGALLKCLSGGTAPRGKKTRLTENEENSVVEWLISNQNLKYNEAIHLVFQEVGNIFQRANRPNPFSNGRPSMDWWYDFLSRHPQIMASKPEWLKRGKVNDQYILDVQSGKLRCTKFRRALLSAIQYIRSLSDGNTHPTVATDSTTNVKSTTLSDEIRAKEKSSIKEEKVTRLTKRIPKNQQIQLQETQIAYGSESKSYLQSLFTPITCAPISSDDIYSSENSFARTILSSSLIPDQKSIDLDNSRLITSLKTVIKPSSNGGHLLLPDDDDDDDYDDINNIKDSIDPAAFLP